MAIQILIGLLLVDLITADPDIVLYSQDNWKGDQFVVQGLDEIGDCVSFWRNGGGVDPVLSRWSDRTRSLKLVPGVCVRLYDADCDWTLKAATLDVTPESPFLDSLDKAGFGSITSGIERIKCPPLEPPLVTLWSEPVFRGDSLPLRNLREIGDCEEFSHPAGHGVKISNDYRKFNDRTQSIQLANGICVRAWQDHCDSANRVIDVKRTSPWARDLAVRVAFRGVVSAIELINCPEPSGIILYSVAGWKGDELVLDNMKYEGDSVSLWDPKWPAVLISEQYRVFNDRTYSIRIPPGYCVRLNTNECGSSTGIVLEETCAGDPWAKNLVQKNFDGKISCVEVTRTGRYPKSALVKLDLPPRHDENGNLVEDDNLF